ncbi:MAG: sigma 54-interacting transcriptional regulator [Dysgonamonadaceae bacterium]|jgi:transcriptional regulator with PAS, ATPase and Fis domain|nr:sigma 54-interacting transcriptional regulator [Dysgonamonadaceae bacterium]
MIDLHQIRQRFGITGNSPLLNREIEKAVLIAPTDLSVLIMGESGVGKEAFPRIIHQNSIRKHGAYIAVNCGAIPEGTIDSELFGHEKGSFTGALSDRKGYFEVADNGTIFLDEVGELPLATQARLLRVLEYGEFLKVGSSSVQKTNVRIIAATNLDLQKAIRNGKFREDLYYRLNTVPLNIPPLRDRQDDIPLLFRKFASDFAEKYKMPAVFLTDDAHPLLFKYHWPGNIRELKNIVERMSIIEPAREISAEVLQTYLEFPETDHLPVLMNSADYERHTFSSERDILYQILFDMRRDINELKKLVPAMGKIKSQVPTNFSHPIFRHSNARELKDFIDEEPVSDIAEYVEMKDVDESLSLNEVEREMIKKALERNKGKRKDAALELKISERTLYRKIKEYEISD